jgi:hypothetical protein
MLQQPLVNRRRLVRGVVVQHQVQVQVLRDGGVDQLEEPEEFLVPVAAVGLGDRRPAGDARPGVVAARDDDLDKRPGGTSFLLDVAP